MLPFVIISDLFKMICHDMSVMSYFPSKLVYLPVFYSHTGGIQPTLFHQIISQNGMLYTTTCFQY